MLYKTFYGGHLPAIYGDVRVSTGARRQNKRADEPAILKTGNFYKLKNNNENVLLAA